mgnify:CR=1 FL=1
MREHEKNLYLETVSLVPTYRFPFPQQYHEAIYLHDLDSISEIIPHLKAPLGRMEVISNYENGGPRVIIDYAHTPDALENSLVALRPHCRQSLWVVFGCGGDRDRGKRPQMAEIAARLADRVVVTSDNPRTEDPQQILDDVVAGIPAGSDLLVEGDRAKAIASAIAEAEPNDLVLVAGKGHEDYQIIGTERRDFDDRIIASAALARRGGRA